MSLIPDFHAFSAHPGSLVRTLGRFTDIARDAFDALVAEPAAAVAAPTRWIAGEVIPVDDCPLEEVLEAFDRLFDPRSPLSSRRDARWSLDPCAEREADPAVRVTARKLAEDGARVLRLRRDGRDVALAGVQPLPEITSAWPLAAAS